MPGKKDAAWWREYRARKRPAAPEAARPETTTPRVPLPPHMDVAGFCQRDGLKWPCTAALLAPPEVIQPRPSFLAAPIDECAACGHDRQSFHLAGPCQAPAGRRRCGCEPFVEDLGFE